jgi:hypothetical protein
LTTSPHGNNALRALMHRHEERKAWEAAHPALAADWTDALAEDMERIEAKAKIEALEARRRHLLETTPSRLLNMGAPPRNVELWAAGLTDTPAWRAVQEMAASGRGFALLTGDTGVGKTTAAVGGMALRVLEDRREDMPAIFVRAVEGARMGLYDAGDKKLAGQMLSAGLLVIDDLGAEFLSEGSIWRSILDEVIDTRYGERSPTILTTNLDGAGFKARYGERIADRIRHAGAPVACGAVSLRKRGEG